MRKNYILKSLLILCLLWAGIGNVSAQETYVKWKLVDGENVSLENNDVVVIVDVATGLAMSNDKDDKDPDAVAVEVNYDKDRLTGDVPENVQWTYTAESGGYKFATDGKNLYADNKGLKVGTEANNVFDISTIDDVDYLHIAVDGKDYLAGIENSFMSNSWKLKEIKEGKPDDKVKDTRIAFFKKVVDSQKVMTLSFPYENYEVNRLHDPSSPNIIMVDFDRATASDNSQNRDIKYYSSEPRVLYPVKLGDTNYAEDPQGNRLYLGESGISQLVARIDETDEYDKVVTYCTIRYNNTYEDLRNMKGSKRNPLTVEEAIKLTKGETVDGVAGGTYKDYRCYFIKGKVNKVNSGLLSMFGDLGLDEIMGDDMDMEERMGDMDDFDMNEIGDMMGGMDLTSMIPGFGKSEGLTYFISDDGTKDNRIKVTNGRGMVKQEDGLNAVSFEELDDLSPGDDVLVYGPLVLSEDKNMFSDLFGNTGGIGGNNQNPTEPTEPEDPNKDKTVKVGELNYLHGLTKTLIVTDNHMYENTTKKLEDENGQPKDQDFFYTINPENPITVGEIQKAQIKSADEEIAKWVYTNDEHTDSVFTAVEPGKTKITVKIKVIVAPAVEGTDGQEGTKEKSYTMKRKFQLEVRSRDKEPEGHNVGEYVLVNDVNELADGTRLLLIGTRTKDDSDTNYALATNNSMMGGGKGGKKVDNDKITVNDEGDEGKERIKFEDVPEDTQEIILEKEGNSWYLNVGKDENGEKLYLYASDTSEEEDDEDPEDDEKFDFSKFMEMFSPSSGLKVATKEDATTKNDQGEITGELGDSCKATITIEDGIATIQFPKTAGKNNTIVLTSAFDMDEMMNMFGEGESTGEGTSSGMDFDFFMASFNTKKIKENDEKCILPRIFGFVLYDEYPINIGDAEWMTIVSEYDVIPAEGVDAYVVTGVTRDEEQSKASLKAVESLKGGEPYLLHSQKNEYIMTRTSDVDKPELNLLQVSDDNTIGEKGTTTVYVLANKNKGVGFYRWTGGKLGSGRVYLPVEADLESPDRFCSFFNGNDEVTTIQAIDISDSAVGPYYDLQGRRVQKLSKGIYVVNGQKIIIK